MWLVTRKQFKSAKELIKRKQTLGMCTENSAYTFLIIFSQLKPYMSAIIEPQNRFGKTLNFSINAQYAAKKV